MSGGLDGAVDSGGCCDAGCWLADVRSGELDLDSGRGDIKGEEGHEFSGESGGKEDGISSRQKLMLTSDIGMFELRRHVASARIQRVYK